MKNLTYTFLILILIFLSLTYQGEKVQSQGIILADNQKIINIFREKNNTKVDQLLQELEEYHEIIIHLGSRKVFERGSAFFYKTSQENLNYFIEELKKDNKKIYLWFLDSFGGKNFLEIYDQYQEIIDANHSQLEKLDLNYDGIIVDLEWINFGTKDNSKKYLEILNYLNSKFSDKEIYAFASLLDDNLENKNRGYYEKEMLEYLDNIIVMLYLKDGGYYLENNQLNLIFKNERIENLREYYNKENYKIAISLIGGIILERNGNLYSIKSSNEFLYQQKCEKLYETDREYYTIKGYEARQNFSIIRDDGVKEEIKSGERLHFLKIKKENLVKTNDYIWEFFLLNNRF